MTRLTIFSAPKPFTNPHINIIQRNAVQTWRHLGPDVEVFLMGDEPGMAQVAAEYGVRQFADVRRNEQGTPLVSSMVELARNASQSPILVCVNADILFLPDLISAVRKLTTHVQKYLLIGQRWDLEVRQLMEFTDGWLLIETPNLYGHDCFEVAHLVSFSPHTLKQVLQQAGFQIQIQITHGRPRSELIPLYITALAKGIMNTGGWEKPNIEPENGVRRKRQMAMLRRRVVTRLSPRKAWLPVDG